MLLDLNLVKTSVKVLYFILLLTCLLLKNWVGQINSNKDPKINTLIKLYNKNMIINSSEKINLKFKKKLKLLIVSDNTK